MSLNIPAINSIITDYLSDDTNKAEVQETLTPIFKDCPTSQNLQEIAYLKKYGSDPKGITDETVDQIVQDLIKSPSFSKLYKDVESNREAENLPRIQIKLLRLDNAGQMISKMGEIRIEKRFDGNLKRSVLIFEMANASLNSEFQKVKLDVITHGITERVEFARRMEMVEAKASKIHDQIILQSIEDGSMDLSMKKLVHNFNDDFEEFWQHTLKKGHAQIYMEGFDDLKKRLLVLTQRLQPQKV